MRRRAAWRSEARCTGQTSDAARGAATEDTLLEPGFEESESAVERLVPDHLTDEALSAVP
ncbi:hypothetical protein [Euzebya tangerina]|uniref:hypothetical protein n=1 Tax=Euzebya tangerina TaxID=591198 RepID=UPI0013C36AC9|nr:hypothetical protein [Euzebya tangerina]